MKKFEDKPIPLIFRNEDKKYEVNPEAVQFFQSIKGKIAVISVAGMYRTGKSYLLNTILLKQKAGFAVGPTTNPKTKGIWVWGKPICLPNEKDQIINVCVLDSEGLGSIEEDINHDLRLFSLTLLLSSMFIYNTLGSIDEHAIDSLGLVLRLCERMRAENYNDFPDFFWVLRDFSLALVGRDNKPLTSNKYLQQSLSPQPGDSDIRNKIRQSIRNSFVNRTCFTFVRPLTNEEELQKLDTMQVDQLRPQFMEQVIDFRRLINSNIKIKKIKGKQMTAEMMVELIRVYTAEINGQELPQIETGWKYICARECQQAMALVEKEAEDAVGKLLNSVPTTKKQLGEKRDAIYEILKKTFESKTGGNDQAVQFIPQISRMLEKMMEKVEGEMRLKNAQQTKTFIKRKFQNVEKRLKAGQIKSMGELVKQFETFYLFYQKTCPYKDEIKTGLQTIMKLFSDSSLILFKSVKNRKDQQNLKLRQEVERLAQDLQSKEERNKHQKGLATDKLAILESKLQQISRQNRQLSDQLTKSELTLQNLRRQKDEGAELATQKAEMEILQLRKKLMNAEQALQEVECTKQFEINNFKNQFLLKENEINHISEERNQLSKKITVLMNELTNEKEERGKRIEQLISSSESSRNQWENVRKSFEERLASRQQQILRLESSLEAKAAELMSLTQQHEKTLKALFERHEAQKHQISDASKEELKCLKEALQSEEEGGVLKIKKLQADYSQKQMQLKMRKLQMDQQMALINQKLQFIRKQCSEKEEKIAKLQEENGWYLSMLEDKDNELNNVNSILDESRYTNDSYQSEAATKVEQLTQNLQIKIKEISILEQAEQKLKSELRDQAQQINQLNEKLKTQAKTYEDKQKEVKEKLAWSEDQAQKNKQVLEEEIQLLRLENTKELQDQKKSAELSLVQLKNYYEMERQRLEKKNLEERKKHENLETILSADFEGKHRKAIRSLQEELQNMRIAKDQLEEQLARTESQWQIRLNGFQEQRQNEKRLIVNRQQILEKKYEQIQSEYDQLQRTYEQQRINYVKKVQSLNFELSRKQKDVLQLNSKRQSLQQSLTKKETQLQSLKKLMNQEIEGALKKVSEIQTKYQKLNEQYMQYRIESEKELALIKQKNEFQNNKLTELSKDKESGSNKNIERLDKQRFGDLKDLNEKLKAEVLALQNKIEVQRKASREQEAATKKQYATLERDYEFLQQKESISHAKISDLESRLSQKSDNFLKQVQEIRAKAADEREKTQKELDQLRENLNAMEDEKNQLTWNHQKERALQVQKIKFMEYQRDQAKKELQQNEKKLGLVNAQLRKANQKASQDNQNRKQQSDKKYINQIQMLKESLRSRTDQYEDIVRKLKEELKTIKQKMVEQGDKLQSYERARSNERNLMEENENLRREKEILIQGYRADRQKELEQWKRKNAELQKKNKELSSLNGNNMFQLEKERSKWNQEKSSYLQKIKGLDEALEWERNKSQLNKSKNELKKSESSSNFNFNEYSKFSAGWK